MNDVNIADDGEQEREDFGTSPEQNIIQDRVSDILPSNIEEATTSKSQTFELANFFSKIPDIAHAKKYFSGFLNQIQQFGFYDKSDTEILNLMFFKAKCAYMNSMPAYKWTKDHTVFLDNVEALFYAIVRGAVGTKENVQNQRTSLNELKISRNYGELGRRRSGFLNRFRDV